MKMKKGVFCCSVVLLLCCLLELFSFTANTLLDGALGPRLNNFARDQSNKTLFPPKVLNPYIGSVLVPQQRTPVVSNYGFTDAKSPIQKRSQGKMIIGVFGGSVAEIFSSKGVNAFKEKIRGKSLFLNKEIVFLNFATGGYKQPQQLMILNYILALGGSFDIVINLDGFNELALPVAENIPEGVFPFFPRMWGKFVARQTMSEKEILARGTIIRYREVRRLAEQFFLKSPLRYSATLQLIWKCLQQYLARKISEKMRELAVMKITFRGDYELTGPTRSYKSEQALYRDLTEVWERCSLQMYKICTANGIQYFHFLQPNQYVPGSKPMGKTERNRAISNRQLYRKPVELGYPYLVEAGKNLVKRGVPFFDLTKVFADNEKPLYVDACCHLNQEGNSILGGVIGEAVLQRG